MRWQLFARRRRRRAVTPLRSGGWQWAAGLAFSSIVLAELRQGDLSQPWTYAYIGRTAGSGHFLHFAAAPDCFHTAKASTTSVSVEINSRLWIRSQYSYLSHVPPRQRRGRCNHLRRPKRQQPDARICLMSCVRRNWWIMHAQNYFGSLTNEGRNWHARRGWDPDASTTAFCNG